MTGPNIVNDRFTEDYPESYKEHSDVTFVQELIEADVTSTTKQLQERVLARRECMGTPRGSPLRPEQLRREYEYICERLFGEEIGFDLYESSSHNFDEEFRDSVDEIAEAWRQKFEERFSREPPIALSDYFFPRRTLSQRHRSHILQILDAEYARLTAEAAQHQVNNFLAIPRGLYNHHKSTPRQLVSAECSDLA